MPQNDKQVKFYFGTQQEYNNLEFKDTCAIYFITDTKKIYVGEKRYVAPINIQDLDNLNLDDKYLSAFEANINRNTVPIIAQNGQLISSGKTIGTSVPENAYFITEENMQTIQNVLQNSTDLQVVGQAPPYYNNNGLMLYTDKEKLDRLPNSLSVATTETNGLMSAEDKEKLDSLSNIEYTIATSNTNGLMSSIDKAKLDNITGISNNTKFEFCTASEYNQMANKAAAIYFILNGSTLLIKDANDNLLTLNEEPDDNENNNNEP